MILAGVIAEERPAVAVVTPTFIASIMAANGVGSNSDTGASGGASSIDTTGATMLCAVIMMHALSAPTPTFSDSKGNTWSFSAVVRTGTDLYMCVAYCFSPTVGAGHTFTSSSSASFSAVFAFGTATGWAFDVQMAGVQPSGSGSPVPTGSITPAIAKAVIIAGFGNYLAMVSGTVDNSFAGGQGVGSTNFLPQLLSGSPCPGGAAYRIFPTAAAISATFTFTPVSSSFGYIIASFKHA